MKPLTSLAVLAAASLCLFFSLNSCIKKSFLIKNPQVDSNANLIAYKNSVHHIFVGFLVADGNDPAAGYDPANAPDSVDFLEFFSGRDTTVADWRSAQAKGTRIVACHFISDAYFDGSVNDPATKVPGYVNPTGFNMTTQNSRSTYYHWARDTYNKEIATQGLDGLDLDVESGTFGGEVSRTKANGDSLVVAIARYYGPNCDSCTVAVGAKKPAFFYDTDGTGGFESTMYNGHESNYDYCLFQAYTTGSHAWTGTGVSGLPALASTYGINKTIYLVNGDSFIYPNGTQDQPGGDSTATANLYAYAHWVVSNSGVGVGVYRMSRDYNHTPPFVVSRTAIQIMNPAP